MNQPRRHPVDFHLLERGDRIDVFELGDDPHTDEPTFPNVEVTDKQVTGGTVYITVRADEFSSPTFKDGSRVAYRVEGRR